MGERSVEKSFLSLLYQLAIQVTVSVLSKLNIFFTREINVVMIKKCSRVILVLTGPVTRLCSSVCLSVYCDTGLYRNSRRAKLNIKGVLHTNDVFKHSLHYFNSIFLSRFVRKSRCATRTLT